MAAGSVMGSRCVVAHCRSGFIQPKVAQRAGFVHRFEKNLRSSHFEVDKSWSDCYGKVDEWGQEPKTRGIDQAIADQSRRSRSAASADREAQNRRRRLGSATRVSGFIAEAGPGYGIRPRPDEKTDASVVWETD